jgi:hypothetical protein
MTKAPDLQLTANATTWYAIESALKFALRQTEQLHDDVKFVQRLTTALSQAITDAEAGDHTARIH